MIIKTGFGLVAYTTDFTDELWTRELIIGVLIVNGITVGITGVIRIGSGTPPTSRSGYLTQVRFCRTRGLKRSGKIKE